ncbi:CheY chemotaxis protein or a CheY-like REC (receiver) domain [Natronincola peptidivorans]|uniref:Stage 0 sporulation protein A homolog n=1 Tax=Natronincola peptidivorans TaxID=426128 RepID=A0A1I0EYV4_9FIRM|nr:response regulator [Natronincola peptidivorans]SET50139.1 CheY chemotaxis protein or a CheY-like REC (receiver) domain [Natronincola peptidivorans]
MEEKHKKSLNVLVVDDEKINQKVVNALFERKGWNVFLASDGEEAIKLCSLKKFDIILMDLNMPKIDGLQATSTIREMERHRKQYTPIIAMTASDTSKEKQKCIEAGMDEYIKKPITEATLWSVIQQILFANNNEIIGLEKVLDNLDGDIELLKELMGDFISKEYAGLLIQEIKNAIDLKDSKALYKKAHKLKGAAACLNIQSIYQSALKLEELGKLEQMNDCENLFNILSKDYESIKDTFSLYIASN